MEDVELPGPPLPEHPQLREIAVAMEEAGVSGEILDSDWKLVFISSQTARIVGVAPEDVGRYYGKSLVVRHIEDPEVWAIINEREWWRLNVPIMRRYLPPGEASFREAFGSAADTAERVEPAADLPRAWTSINEYPSELAVRRTILGDVRLLDMRVNDDDGRFLGVVQLTRTALPEGLLTVLGRGDRGLFERMHQVREPGRRPASILFADLEASATLSRRLASAVYFELIGSLTDLIDSAVIARSGIVGKHAGDGGSALFLAVNFDGSESAAARAAIEAARTIRDGASELGPDGISPQVNVGLHWGGTLMVGQVATNGRLEVTALGDAMNEGARIEAAARNGSILASKELIERLDPGDASEIGINPDSVDYVPLGDLEGASEKAVRDAGTIPVAEI